MAVLRVRKFWYETILGLQRYMVAVSRVVVNHDCRGGTAPDALVWDNGEGEVSSIVRRRPGSTLSMLPFLARLVSWILCGHRPESLGF